VGVIFFVVPEMFATMLLAKVVVPENVLSPAMVCSPDSYTTTVFAHSWK
jgi:hypothetical protein